RWYQHDNLLGLTLEGAARGQAAGGWVNRRWIAELLEVTPLVYGGRFVFRALLDVRQDDLNNTQNLLGGGNGLRGAAPELLTGRDVLLVNAEYRAAPFEIRTLYVGLVFFYDAGSAFRDAP